MPRTMKAYLPRWVLRVIIPILLLVFGLITYLAFFDEKGREEVGVLGWALVTAILLLVGGAMWAMGTHRLPAYILELDEDDKP